MGGTSARSLSRPFRARLLFLSEEGGAVLRGFEPFVTTPRARVARDLATFIEEPDERVIGDEHRPAYIT